MLLGLVVWFWLDDSPSTAKWLTDDDKACLNEMLEADKLERIANPKRDC